MWAIDRLIPYARNARTYSEAQVSQLASSIQEFGWTIPVLVDEAGGLIAGHGRLLAAQQLGITECPVMVARGWPDVKKRAYVLADNKLALNAGWDEDLLRIEMSELEALGFDLALTGFTEDDISALFAKDELREGLTDPDDVPDLDNPLSKQGDVWVLGAHKVMCGDSTSISDVESLMDGLMADACWTDPPYNVNYETKLAGKIKNDSMADGKFKAFLYDAFVSAFSVMKPGAPIYVAHADTEGLNFRGAFKDAEFKISGCLVWAKNSLVLGRSDYQWQHEPILYGWKPGAAHRWYGGRKQTTLMQLGGSIFTQNEDGSVSVKIGDQTIVISGDNLIATQTESTIIRCEKPKRSSVHPTMKPVELVSKMLRNSTRAGDIVIDLFGGSGSTLISCQMLGRSARLMELDAKFVDVIIRRWQDFTGTHATLDGDGRTFADIAAERVKAAA